MKKTLILAWILFVMLTSVQAKTITQWSWIINAYENKVATIENTKLWFVLIKPRKTKLVFMQDGMTARQLRQAQDATLVLNAWYFGYGDETTKRPFVPAWSYPRSTLTHPDDVPCSRDRNLCWRVDTQTLKIQTSWSPVTNSVLNTGPVLMEYWKINTEIFSKQSHRLTPNYRTVLINSNKYGNFFLVSTQKRTLLDTTVLIRSWFPNATAINLDGWSSTAWSSRDWWFNSNKVLPTYFVLE
jgi:hypothetical protein